MSVDWNTVCDSLMNMADRDSSLSMTQRGPFWRYGQDRTLRFVAERLRQQPGLLIADEVGLGKTRVAMAVIEAVLAAGGTAAAVVPPGLLYQWDTEWQAYQHGLVSRTGSGEPRAAPLHLRSYQAIFEAGGGTDFPLTERKRWLLLSHNFGLPRVHANAQSWRYRLPAFVKALRAQHENPQGWRHSRWYQFIKNETACLGDECDGCTNDPQQCWSANERRAAQFLADEFLADEHDLDSLFAKSEILDKFRDADSAKACLNEQGEGRRLFCRLVGELLGPVDLVIIDEAHKSRDPSERTALPSKVLGELLASILRVRGRRIGLSATPVELGTEQWLAVLARVGVDKPPAAEIARFSEALARASLHPDQPRALQALVEASGAFKGALEPFVTRRRRVHQEQMRALLGAGASDGEAQPHRRSSRFAVTYREISSEWRPLVLALEGLGKAAKGLTQGARTAKLADLRYATGHLAGVDVDAEGAVDPLTSAKLAGWQEAKRRRVAFWQKLIAERLDPIKGEGGKGYEDGRIMAHPRVLAVVDRIEEILWNNRIDSEKVLVFGVFSAPLRALRDVINQRATLRLLDAGLPLPGKPDSHNVEALWRQFESVRRQAHNRKDGHGPPPFRGEIEALADRNDLRERVVRATGRYERIRDNLANHVDRAFLARLPGDAAIVKLPEAKQDDLAALLRGRVVNEWIGNPRQHQDLLQEEETERRRNEARKRAREIWAEYLQCHIETGMLDGSNGSAEHTEYDPDEDLDAGAAEKMKALDGLGDRMSPDLIDRLIQTERDHTARFASFAWLMDGSMRMETRRVVQAQFNRAGVFPRVLIAQSRVGREGLNLHIQCRRVILFHTEWNPAVIEQQIGRVDRIESLWERLAESWQKEQLGTEMPKIEIEHVVFEGTYDEYQARVFEKRRQSLNAQLFGQLLDGDAARKVPAELVEALKRAAPDFSPRQLSSKHADH